MDYIAVIDKLEKELAEQCRLNAMGQEREAKFLACIERMNKINQDIITRLKSQ